MLCKIHFNIFSCAIILLLFCLAFTVVSGKAFRPKKKELVPLPTLSKLSDRHQDLTQTLTEASKLKKLTYTYAYTYTAPYNLYKKAQILDVMHKKPLNSLVIMLPPFVLSDQTFFTKQSWWFSQTKGDLTHAGEGKLNTCGWQLENYQTPPKPHAKFKVSTLTKLTYTDHKSSDFSMMARWTIVMS